MSTHRPARVTAWRRAGLSLAGALVVACAPVRPGDTVHAKVTVKEVFAEKGRVALDTVCTVGDTVVIDGEAMLMPTSRKKREAAGK